MIVSEDFDYTQLTTAQRILLAQELWDSVLEGDAVPATTPAQQTEIERRIALADSGQMPGTPWAKVKAALRQEK